MSPGDVVLVPFPYTERSVSYRRPALVIGGPLGPPGNPLLWVLMITDRNNRPWPGDVFLEDRYGDAGLVAPSVVRTAKIANIEMQKATPLGRLAPQVMADVVREIRRHLDPILAE